MATVEAYLLARPVGRHVLPGSYYVAATPPKSALRQGRRVGDPRDTGDDDRMITDLGHPAFAAHDVERTLEFYALLGIGEALRLHHDDGSLMLVYLHVSGDRFIEVFPGAPPDPNRTQSFMHVCLLTDNPDATVEHLRRSGAPIDRERAVGLDGNQ